jgi:hypothetical protein
MEPQTIAETEAAPRADEQVLVHEWRAERLRELGLPRSLAEGFADRVDWRSVARLVERGCPPVLALEIMR